MDTENQWQYRLGRASSPVEYYWRKYRPLELRTEIDRNPLTRRSFLDMALVANIVLKQGPEQTSEFDGKTECVMSKEGTPRYIISLNNLKPGVRNLRTFAFQLVRIYYRQNESDAEKERYNLEIMLFGESGKLFAKHSRIIEYLFDHLPKGGAINVSRLAQDLLTQGFKTEDGRSG